MHTHTHYSGASLSDEFGHCARIICLGLILIPTLMHQLFYLGDPLLYCFGNASKISGVLLAGASPGCQGSGG